ncbi:MAG TPA: hypothetical protein VFR28_09945 [Allosphingosinicella sp.]|jgi:hypothetical protein|nr:hypothetical protein [Allosphingosinicella sp.]
MSRIGAILLAAAAGLSSHSPAAGQAPARSAEASIEASVRRWYDELLKKDEARIWTVVAPGYIEASPPYRYPASKSRAATRPVYDSLAATALKFDWEIISVRRDSTFAKVKVWERAYYYAAAAQKTYELAASTTFVLERQEKDGRWMILAHESSTQGIPPNRVTDPMPDLRSLYYSTEGKHRDPAKDAAEAAASRF